MMMEMEIKSTVTRSLAGSLWLDSISSPRTGDSRTAQGACSRDTEPNNVNHAIEAQRGPRPQRMCGCMHLDPVHLQQC